MAGMILPKGVITVTPTEYVKIRGTLRRTEKACSVLLNLFEAVSKRADKEYQSAMKILRGLPPTNRGGDDEN